MHGRASLHLVKGQGTGGDRHPGSAGVPYDEVSGGVRIVPEAKTRLVEIMYESSDPRFAAVAANTLADEYTTQNLDMRLDTIQKNLRWLSDEVVKQEKKVSDAEAAITKYRDARQRRLD